MLGKTEGRLVRRYPTGRDRAAHVMQASGVIVAAKLNAQVARHGSIAVGHVAEQVMKTGPFSAVDHRQHRPVSLLFKARRANRTGDLLNVLIRVRSPAQAKGFHVFYRACREPFSLEGQKLPRSVCRTKSTTS